MVSLSLARVLQGLGGGGLMALAQSLIGETVPPRERARFQGYLAAVFVTSNAFGPVAGGYLTEAFGWRSIFLINIPLGIFAALMVRRLPARPRGGDPFRFDFSGLGWFVLFIVPALLALERIQAAGSPFTPAVAALGGVALVSLGLLLRRETRVITSYSIHYTKLYESAPRPRRGSTGSCPRGRSLPRRTGRPWPCSTGAGARRWKSPAWRVLRGDVVSSYNFV